MAGAADKQYDIFLSYSRTPDAEAAATLKQALEAAGLSVWMDNEGIRDHEPITTRVVEALRNSRLLLAYYSETYPTRRYCQWELTLAVLAAEREGRDVPNRALVISPDGDAERVHPATLRSTLFRTWAPGEDTAALVEGVRQHLEAVSGPMADIVPAAPRRWIGANPNRHLTDFVGRLSELWEVHGALAGETVLLTGEARAPQGGEGTAQLRACGGMGKSMLAEEYARRFAPAYPGGIFWLSATGAAENWPDRLIDQWVRVLTRMDPKRDWYAFLQGFERQEDQLVALLAKLAALEPAERPYLWVVDDIPHGTKAEALQHWLAPTDGGRTLITTRDRGLTGVGCALDVGELDECSAVALLTARRKPKGGTETAAARAIVKTLGYYPLAIAVAARLANSYGSFADLLTVVASPDEDAKVLAKDLHGELPNGHESNIVATLRLSFREAEADGRPDALDPLRFAACVQPQHPIDIEALIAAYGERARDYVERLDRLSLLDLSIGKVTVHPVICRAVALDSESRKISDAKHKATSVFGDIISGADNILSYEVEDIILHGLALVDEVSGNDQAKLAGWLGRYYSEKGRHKEALDLYFIEYNFLKNTCGEEDGDVLVSLNNIDCTLTELGRYEGSGNHPGAICLLQEILSRRERVLGPENEETLTVKNNLASTLSEADRHDEALGHAHETLERRLRFQGEDDSDVLEARSNIAVILHRAGRLDEAYDIESDIIEKCRKGANVDKLDVVRFRNNLACTLIEKEDYKKSLDLLNECLADLENLGRSNNAIFLMVLQSLAAVKHFLGQHEEAIKIKENSLESWRHNCGEGNPKEVDFMLNLASSLREGQQHEYAQLILEEAYNLSRSIFGDISRKTLECADSLVSVMREQELFSDAANIASQILSRCSESYGIDSEETLIPVRMLAEIFYEKGDFLCSQEWWESAVELSIQYRGLDDLFTFGCEMSLAVTLWQQGRLQEAAEIMKYLISRMKCKLGREHPETLEASFNLAQVILDLDYPAGKRLFLDTLRTAERAHPELPLTEELREYAAELQVDLDPGTSP